MSDIRSLISKPKPRKIMLAYVSTLLLLTASVLAGSTVSIEPQYAAAVTPFTDFNGDGFADLAIGVPGESVGSVIRAGAVNVIYGSSAGLSATAAKADQLWTQNSADIEGGAESIDEFGNSLATGDFNNDGFTDLAIGVQREDIGTVAITDAGAVNVIYGSSQGLRATAVAAGDGRADQIWTQDSTNIEEVAETDDNFGASLAVGDFNGDGFADLAIGVPNENCCFSNIQDVGMVHVLYGSSSGLSAISPIADQLWLQGSSSLGDTPEASDRFGSSLSTGDFNNDGRDDLAIGVPNESVDGNSIAGAVNVLYGSSTGLQATGTGGPDDQVWTQNTPGVDGDASDPGDRFGHATATGDFNNDGFDDLAIGVPGEDDGSLNAVGLVNVIYGSSSGLSGLTVPDQLWGQDSADIEDTPEDGDQFGHSLSTGDFNNDGFDDLAIMVPFEDEGGITDAGAVNVIYGSSNGLSATSATDQFWNQGSIDIDGTLEQNDYFSSSIAAGDFNNDGSGDLAVGAANEDLFDINDNVIQDAGAINVIYGSSSGLSATAKADQVWHQNSASIEETAESFNSFGFSLASG